MIVKLLTEHHLEFLSLEGDYRGLSESTHAKMPHCWKSRALAQKYSLTTAAARFLVIIQVDNFDPTTITDHSPTDDTMRKTLEQTNQQGTIHKQLRGLFKYECK